MLLNDVAEQGGPQDPFKINRVMKPGTREVTDKVTNLNHFNNKNLTGVIAPEIDRKMKVTWSECMSQFAGKDRLFAKVIEQAKAYEANDLRRELETEQFHKQRKRGTTEENHQRSNVSMSVSKPHPGTKSSTTAALVAPSKNNTDTIDTVSLVNYPNPVQHARTVGDRAHTTGSVRDDQSVMG